MVSVQSTSVGLPVSSPESKKSNRDFLKAAPTSFGLELEFNLAFHETELHTVLDRYNIPHNKVQGASAVKTLNDDQHRNLLTTIQDEPSHQCRQQYPSWNIDMPSDNKDPYFTETMKSLVQSSGQTNGLIRRYMSEHLLIAQSAIKHQNPEAQVDVCAFMRRKKDITLPNAGSEDYLRCQSANLSHWTLTNDHTLMGSLKSQHLNALPTKVNQDNINNWDSAGVELISPILQLANKQDAIKTLKSYLTALQESQSRGLRTSKWAGMHTHIGLNINTPEELDANILFFEHLAFILISSEDLISACFPRKCSGIKPSTPNQTIPPSDQDSQTEWDRVLAEIKTLEEVPENENAEQKEARNARVTELDEKLATLTPPNEEQENAQENKTREQLQAEEDARVLAAEAAYTGYDSINSNARYLAATLGTQHPVPSTTLASTIFKQGQSFTDLINLIQSPKDLKAPNGERFRGYMYNFANLHNIALGKDAGETWKIPKPTIEFRQHECTIDAAEVRHWVRFTEAIVTKAASLASGSEIRVETREQEQTYAAGETAKYANFNFPTTSMTQYCAWLGLGEEEQEYWQARHEKNKGDRPSESEE